MSTGLPTDDPWADRQESCTADELESFLAAGVRTVWQPGERFQYSNLGYAMLGRVISLVSGIDYCQFVERELLQPLGLRETHFAEQDYHSPSTRPVVGYRKTAVGWLALPQTGPGAFSAIGGLWSTPEDLLRWGRWLASACCDEPEPGPLSAASRLEMQQPHTLFGTAAGAGYGWGLVVTEHPSGARIVSHSGGYPGFSSHLRWIAGTYWAAAGFENGTYAGALAVVPPALDLALAEVTPPARRNAEAPACDQPWPETVRATEQLTEQVRRGAAAQLDQGPSLSSNVVQDAPLAERAARFGELLEQIGGAQSIGEVRYPDAARAVRELTGPRGSVRLEISLTPIEPVAVQEIAVTLVQGGAAGS